MALLGSDVEQTVRFYPEVLEFPLTEIFENRDYRGSNHSSSKSETTACWPTSTCRVSTLGPYAEVLGGLPHLTVSVEPERWACLKKSLNGARVNYQMLSGGSLSLRNPDPAWIELIAPALGQMYGTTVL